MKNEVIELTVRQLEFRNELQFISNSQDVQPINEMFNTEYDSFFVHVGDGDYNEVYGMYGIVPTFEKLVFKLK